MVKEEEKSREHLERKRGAEPAAQGLMSQTQEGKAGGRGERGRKTARRRKQGFKGTWTSGPDYFDLILNAHSKELDRLDLYTEWRHILHQEKGRVLCD